MKPVFEYLLAYKIPLFFPNYLIIFHLSTDAIVVFYGINGMAAKEYRFGCQLYWKLDDFKTI
jgi:hypothetical protein